MEKAASLYRRIRSTPHERSLVVEPWHTIEQVQLPEGMVTVMDALPDNSHGTIVLLPGIGHSIPMMQPIAKRLVDHDLRVLTSQHPGRRMHFRPEDKTEAQREARITQGVLDHKGIDESIIALAHSHGTKTAVRLAEAGRAHLLVFFNPVGLIDPRHRPVRYIIGRWGKAVVDAARTSVVNPSIRGSNTALYRGTWDNVRDNFWRAGQKVHESASVSLLNRIQALREQGVGVVVAHGTNDAFFPFDEVERNAMRAGIDRFIAIPGGSHNMLHEQTELVLEHVLPYFKQGTLDATAQST